MTNAIKCNTCNIIIDELLSYVQNKISVIDEETLVRLCTTSFTSIEIQNSKTLLFESLPTNKRNIQRKRDGKAQRDINDIIQLFKITDPDVIPIFVARQLEKLPPVTFDHLDCTKLLKDLVRLQADINEVKMIYATAKDVEDLKIEVSNLKRIATPTRLSLCTVNNRRGAWCMDMDSGPVGLSHTHNSTGNGTAGAMKDDTLSLIRNNESIQYRSMVMSGSNPTAHCKEIIVPDEVTAAGEMSQRDDQLIEPECASLNANILANSVDQQPLTNLSKDEGEFETVVYKKKKVNYRYRGQIGAANESNTLFKAAERKIPMFITNIHIDTQEHDIAKYILEKTQETVSLEKINMKRPTGHKAYKFFVCPSKLPIFLDVNNWPQGIIFRRFIHFRKTHTIGTNSENGKKK
ncbi:uncharacterized protein [Choristoneura fumiferana]|uniref:uncharacterized protein n=1 Tax=Choristoneura fumiferana TaxID=7141 RepID=UPI003D15C476